MSQHERKGAVAYARDLISLWPEREIVVRSDGAQKSFRLSARMQLATIGVFAGLFVAILWAAVSLASSAAAIKRERAALAAEGRLVEGKAGKVARYRESVDRLARDLEERQDFIDDLYRTHFGDGSRSAGAELLGAKDKARTSSLNTKISDVSKAESLLKVDMRQRRFANLLTEGARRRADSAATAIRSLGLNPDAIMRSASRAQGGPYVPWPGDHAAMPAEFEKLASALSRMEVLEDSLSAMPSGRPTAAPMLSSSYGYRRDPFNGHAAFHAGIDFPGSYGQPILAAAPGKVSFIGQRSGYGNVVEIEHANGLMTRYAHLSGFTARLGQRVGRGDSIARMGSTGRSTGTHLHFEVRLRGEAINPRRFLEAGKDVLNAQQVARTRLSSIEARG